jgi:hypothetical protein
LGLADTDLELVAVAPEEEAEAALADPVVVTTACGLVVADADVARL